MALGTASLGIPESLFEISEQEALRLRELPRQSQPSRRRPDVSRVLRKFQTP